MKQQKCDDAQNDSCSLQEPLRSADEDPGAGFFRTSHVNARKIVLMQRI
jgi:hypothetical protein